MSTSTPRPAVKIAVVVTYLAMVITNILANALPINGRRTGEISDGYANLFAPAGLTFSIWGVIYLLLGAHVLYQLGLFRDKTPHTDAARPVQDRLGTLFAASSLVNVGWILAWHYDLIGVSTLLIAGLLVLLILITRAVRSLPLASREGAFLRLPFSVYFGWITVATIANVTVWLVSIGWDGFGLPESTWTVIMLVVGALIGCAVILRDGDPAYGLVLVWAYFGIWFKHTSPEGFGGAHPTVSTTALLMIAAFAACIVVVVVRTVRSGSLAAATPHRAG